MHKKKEPDQKDLKQIELEAVNHSYTHLVDVHRKMIDSIHQIEIGNQVSTFDKIQQDRAMCLLMDEDCADFNQYNLKIYPMEQIKFGISYLMVLLSILLKTKEN